MGGMESLGLTYTREILASFMGLSIQLLDKFFHLFASKFFFNTKKEKKNTLGLITVIISTRSSVSSRRPPYFPVSHPGSGPIAGTKVLAPSSLTHWPSLILQPPLRLLLLVTWFYDDNLLNL